MIKVIQTEMDLFLCHVIKNLTENYKMPHCTWPIRVSYLVMWLSLTNDKKNHSQTEYPLKKSFGLKGWDTTAEKLWPNYVICRESEGSKNLGGQTVIEVFVIKHVLLSILPKFWKDNYPPYPPSLDGPVSIDSKQRKKGASLISTLSCWSVRSFDLFGPPNFVCSSRAVGRYGNRGGDIMWWSYIICPLPPGWNRVNWSAKKWEAAAPLPLWSFQSPNFCM